MVPDPKLDQIAPIPRLSIGLPVYNGGEQLRAVIGRVLAQGFGDFELLISDNASTDHTESICREYAAGDARVRYHRNGENIGPARNFLQVMEQATGDYFIWTAHDDEWLDGHLESLVGKLDADPSAVLAVNGWNGIDPEGRPMPIRIPAASVAAADNRGSFRRYLTAPYFEVSKACFVYGMIRRKTLASLPVREILGEMHNIGHDRPIGRDVLLVLALLGHGNVAYAPEERTWHYRYKGPRKYRTLLKKSYDLLRFPLLVLLGKRKAAWRNIRIFHREVAGLIGRHFNGGADLRLANLFSTIRLCALFK